LVLDQFGSVIADMALTADSSATPEGRLGPAPSSLKVVQWGSEPHWTSWDLDGIEIPFRGNQVRELRPEAHGLDRGQVRTP